jgi:hypothetical protein
MVRHRNIAIFCVAWTVIVVIAVVAVQYFTKTEWVIDRHVKAKRSLSEKMDGGLNTPPVRAARMAWYGHQHELIRLGYLEEWKYFVPIVNDDIHADELLNALQVFKMTNWVSSMHFEPRPGEGLVINVADVPERQEDWKAIVDQYSGNLE